MVSKHEGGEEGKWYCTRKKKNGGGDKGVEGRKTEIKNVRYDEKGKKVSEKYKRVMEARKEEGKHCREDIGGKRREKQRSEDDTGRRGQGEKGRVKNGAWNRKKIERGMRRTESLKK